MNTPPAPREPLRLDLEDIRCWLLEHIDGGEEVKGYDSMLSTYINTIDAALAALPSEMGVMGLEPRGCPTPGSCSAVEELADLKQRLLPQANGRAERAEKARQMAVVERDALLEQLIAANSRWQQEWDARIAAELHSAPSATAATEPDRPDWAQQLPGAELYDRAARYEYIRTLNPRQFAALYDEALADERFDDLVDRYRDAGEKHD